MNAIVVVRRALILLLVLPVYAAVVAVACAAGARRGRAADLRIEQTAPVAPPELTLRHLRVVNRGNAEGEAVITLSIQDPLGRELARSELLGGAPLRMPPAHLGGGEGRVVPIDEHSAVARTADSLLQLGNHFQLHAAITTRNGVTNTHTRRWGQWSALRPGTSLTLVIPLGRGGQRVRVRHASTLPPGASLAGSAHLAETSITHSTAVTYRTEDWLPHGSTIVLSAVVSDSSTGEVLQQHEQTAVYDTVPPFIGSYRAVLLRDGRIAVQIRAGDRHSGVPENGVITRYSVDTGHTWRETRHRFAYDDLGRPALFETVIGPLKDSDEVLLCLSVTDMAGNLSTDIPHDGVVMLAPPNAEHVLDALGTGRPDGNPLFAPGWVKRMRQIVDSRRGISVTAATSVDSDTRRFERRRLQDLAALLSPFEMHNVDLDEFALATFWRADSPGPAGCNGSSLRILVEE